MGNQEVAAKALAAPLNQHMRWQTGCVGRDNSVGREDAFQLAIEIMLDIEPLNYSFDHPIDAVQLLQIILDVTHSNKFATTLAVKCRWPGFEGFFKAGAGDLAAVFCLAGWHDVEQQAGDADIGQMSGNGGSHHSCTEHGG